MERQALVSGAVRICWGRLLTQTTTSGVFLGLTMLAQMGSLGSSTARTTLTCSALPASLDCVPLNALLLLQDSPPLLGLLVLSLTRLVAAAGMCNAGVLAVGVVVATAPGCTLATDAKPVTFLAAVDALGVPGRTDLAWVAGGASV
jgi:hypothetical protein